ncbi:MAG TPA: hypothetical protein VNH21_03175 [Steroidobacteraceae bacterium]|nr:hypothetical protein [Steroidobacteraceae bacterium]
MAVIDRRGATVDASATPLESGPTTTLAIKAPCLVATTANITLSGTQTIDGVSVGSGSERVLVKDQTDQTTNGIYVASTGNWTRAVDAASNTSWTEGTLVYVQSGTAGGGNVFAQTTFASPLIIGTNNLTFAFAAQFISALAAGKTLGRNFGAGTGAVQIIPLRQKLDAALTLYADFVNGNDANDGLTAGAAPAGTTHGAFKTVQAAYNALTTRYDTGGQNVTISFNNNDTQGLVITFPWAGGGQLAIQGPGGSPPSIGLVPSSGSGITVLAPLPATLFLLNFKVSGLLYGVSLQAPGKISVKNLNFAATGTAHISALVPGASIVANGSYTISGGAAIHWYAALGGNITMQIPLTLSGTPAFSAAFAASDTISLVYAGGASYSGSATGSRYFVNNNAVVNTGTSGNPNALPGNSAGTASNGGIYQ